MPRYAVAIEINDDLEVEIITADDEYAALRAAANTETSPFSEAVSPGVLATHLSGIPEDGELEDMTLSEACAYIAKLGYITGGVAITLVPELI